MDGVVDESSVASPEKGGRGWRALAAEVLLTLLVVAAAEVGFRAYVAQSPTLPLPRLLNSSIATAKYLAFERGAAQGRHADIILMGLSPMMVINSGRMGEVLASHGHRAEVFNFAFPYHALDFDRFLLRDIVLPTQGEPRVIVYGVMPFNLLYEHDSRDVEAETRRQPAFQLHQTSPAALLRSTLMTRFDLVLYGEVIRDSVSGKSGKPDPWVERARGIDERGDAARLPPRRAPRRLPLWEARVYRPQMMGFRKRLSQGLLRQHLGALGAFCRQHGIRLLVVNTAVSPFFPELLANGRRDYDEYVRYLAAAAKAAGAAFLDLSGPDLGPADAFVDTHHLNETAALATTDRLAAYLLDEGMLDDAS